MEAGRHLIYGLHVIPIDQQIVSFEDYDDYIENIHHNNRIFVCYTPHGLPKLIFHSPEGYVLITTKKENLNVTSIIK